MICMKEGIGRKVICPHRNRNIETSIEFSKLLFLELSSYSFFHSSSIMLIKIHVKTIHIFFFPEFSLGCCILKLTSRLVSRLSNTWLLSTAYSCCPSNPLLHPLGLVSIPGYSIWSHAWPSGEDLTRTMYEPSCPSLWLTSGFPYSYSLKPIFSVLTESFPCR